MTGQYDCHTHTLLSDGEMLPIELVRRCAVLGYATVAITDHADSSNITELLQAVRRIEDSAKEYGIELLCGVELTHVPPSRIPHLARRARAEGADLVVVHGETVVEPVASGTNHVACECGEVDLLAHPGLLELSDAKLATENHVALELTSRSGHNRANGHVVRCAREKGCTLVINSDAHAPQDLMDKQARWMVARGAGLTEDEAENSLNLNILRWMSKRR